jgi:hypothetical protein
MCSSSRFPTLLGKWLVLHFPLSKVTGEIRQNWYDEISALALFLVYQVLLPPLLVIGKWNLEAGLCQPWPLFQEKEDKR